MSVIKPALPGVYQIDLPWVNAWLLASAAGAVLIDSGTRWDRRRILEAFDTLFPDGVNLRNVLLTHGHCDHAGNAAFLCERYGASLSAHADEAPFIATCRTYIPRGIRAFSPKGICFGAGELIYPV